MLKIPTYPNLTALAYLQVKQFILEGALKEGSKLTEESLAKQLGISKSPVREALNRLESEGLVSIEPRRGAFVRTFSLQEACDLFDVRLVLEVHAVGSADVTPALLLDLAGSIERTRTNLAVENVTVHIEEDIYFHSAIAKATGNQELCRILKNINQKSVLCRSKTFPLSGNMAPDGHHRVYSALNEGNRAFAMEAMREHIVYTRDALLGSLNKELVPDSQHAPGN